MLAVVFYDNDFGLGAWIGAQMMAGILDYHNIPSFDRLLQAIKQYQPSDGTVYTCGTIPMRDTIVAYVGCHQQSHIVIKCCRNFMNLYRVDQSQYVFIRTPSIRLKWLYKRSDIPFHSHRLQLTKQLYKQMVDIFPEIQAAVCSIVWPSAPLFRTRNLRNVDLKEAGIDQLETPKQYELKGKHIVYHCYGSAHSSITSAAIHLNRLPQDRKPKIREIIALTDYDRAETWQIGTLNFKGYDKAGCAVYTIGLGADPYTVKRMLSSFLPLIGCDTSELIMQEALIHINRIARIGGALSRRYGYVRVGRTLSAYGIQKQYDRLLQFVQSVCKMCGNGKNKS